MRPGLGNDSNRQRSPPRAGAEASPSREAETCCERPPAPGAGRLLPSGLAGPGGEGGGLGGCVPVCVTWLGWRHIRWGLLFFCRCDVGLAQWLRRTHERQRLAKCQLQQWCSARLRLVWSGNLTTRTSPTRCAARLAAWPGRPVFGVDVERAWKLKGAWVLGERRSPLPASFFTMRFFQV